MNELSHIDAEGKAKMVDVGNKPVQKRTAKAYGHISLQPQTISLVKENQMKKGDVLGVAQIAGIQAAKLTSMLIPLCHPLLLTSISVVCTLTEKGVSVNSTVICSGQTGVEMEALTAVNVALLTIYDMCKAIDKQMVITDIKLIEKIKE